MKKWITLGLVFLFLFSTGLAGAVAHQWPHSRCLEAAHLSYSRADWTVNWSLPPADLKGLQRSYQEATGVPTPAWPEHYIHYRLKLEYADRTDTLYISWDYQVYCPVQQEVYPDLSETLLANLEALNASFFGRPLPWSTVNQLWPRKTKALATDLDTGRSFWLFRWGGNLHADVEPLTAGDAQIMKEVFGEHTWRRRAVVVQVQGHRIAASLHSMPHGGGDISGNEFAGHCCMHFSESMTHGTRQEDPAHSIMVYKAAGMWWQTLAEDDPGHWVHHCLTILAQRDFVTLEVYTATAHRCSLKEWAKELSSMRITSITVNDQTHATAEVVADLTFYQAGSWEPQQMQITFKLERHKVSHAWQLVDAILW